MTDKYVLRIFVPDYDNSGQQFPIEHHWQWDEKVREIAGGLTIFKAAKGQWLNPDGKLFTDKMIPVEVMCSQDDISKIIDMTMDHYRQEAIYAHKMNVEPIIRYAQTPASNDEDKSTDITIYPVSQNYFG